jgi:isopentenyl-diphosphate delta-isomerase type 1
MSNEVFDIVNDRDQVVDQRFRVEVHRLGLKHRAVHVLVFNAKGHLYLQKRSHQKDTFPGAWDSSASGHLAAGEEYDACAVRELHEEIGITARQPPERLFKVQARPETGQEFVWVYRLQHEGPFQLNPAEVEFAAFFRSEDVDRWMAERPRDFADSFRLIWKWIRHGPPKKTAAQPASKSAPRHAPRKARRVRSKPVKSAARARRKPAARNASTRKRR